MRIPLQVTVFTYSQKLNKGTYLILQGLKKFTKSKANIYIYDEIKEEITKLGNGKISHGIVFLYFFWLENKGKKRVRKKKKASKKRSKK